MKLVFIDNQRPVTDSLIIAESFGKRHDHVLRDIRELECSQEFSLSNFGECDYTAQNGQTYTKYLITQDGFSFLVMGYTGKEAARFKEMYINEFNRMKNQITQPQLPQNYVEALKALVSSEEEKQSLQLKIESDKPLVHFAESLQISKDSILIGELAKLLRQNGIMLGARRLFEQLRADGYLIKSGSEYNNPTQRSMELGIMEIRVGTRNSSDGTLKITHTTKITGKGQVYFINKYKPFNQAM